MQNNLTDDELIHRYVASKKDSDFRILVERHHDRLFSRFLRELKNWADAMDLEQQLWLQVFRNIQSYQSEGRFAHYLSRIATNLLNDFWRKQSSSSNNIMESRLDEGLHCDEFVNRNAGAINSDNSSQDAESSLANEELITYLVSVLIPQLPVEQRTVWLLRHESEYWEPDCRINWQHLANLNGMDEAGVWNLFEVARDKLMRTMFVNQDTADTAATDSFQSGRELFLQEDEKLVFVVWTQAQRMRKEQQFTWEYFAGLLHVSENTLKTRYRTAQKTLNEGLVSWMNAKPENELTNRRHLEDVR